SLPQPIAAAGLGETLTCKVRPRCRRLLACAWATPRQHGGQRIRARGAAAASLWWRAAPAAMFCRHRPSGLRKLSGGVMAGRPSGRSVSALRSRYEQRSERLTTMRHVRAALVSLAGLIGKPVLNQAGEQMGARLNREGAWLVQAARLA